VNDGNTAVRTMIRQLQDGFNQTLDALYDLPEEYLQQRCGHSCARGGSARDLLVHNIFHEKQHTGQVWNVRDELRLLQGWDNASLYPLLVDYYLSRAQLITSLFGLTDEQLDASPPEGGWSVRQTIEHALGSERRSISALNVEFTESTYAAGRGRSEPGQVVAPAVSG
jgi:uncharacterized damage-inducible protein DinB